MHVLTNLGTGANGRPGINHGALIDMGPEVHEGRHQNHARRDIGRFANNAIGHGTETCLFPLGFTPALELAVDLVPPAGALRAAGLLFHILDAEAQQHCLLGPLVDMPVATVLTLSHTQLAGIQCVQGLFDRIALLTCGG